jgi:hypothetical protein
MNVVVTVVTAPTAVTLLAGVQVAGVKISLTDSAGNAINDANNTPIAPATVTSSPYTASFASVPAGSYLAVAEALDSTGATLGSAVKQPFSVTNPAGGSNSTSYDAPQSVTVSVS